MFENFTKSKPKRRGLRLLAIGSAVIHIAAGALLIILGLWEIEEVGRPHRGLAMATTMPAAAAPAGESAAAPEKIKPKKQVVRDPRQPNRDKDSEDHLATKGESNSSSGRGEGDAIGEGEGPGSGPPGLPGLELCFDPDRCGGGAPIPQIVEKPETPALVPPAVLGELRRTAGDPQVQPPSSTKNEMSRTGESRIIAVVRLCLDTAGSVNSQSIVKSSGHEEYDAKLVSAIRKWRYEPYRANGSPAAICTHLTFIYQQE